MDRITDLTERLRECPFCGGEATIVISDLRPCNVEGWTDGYSVFCRESVRCSGRLPKFHKTRVEAIAAWNKRPTLETLTQENARLREAGWRNIESAPTDPEDPISPPPSGARAMNKLVTLTRFAIGRALVHAGLSIMPASRVRSEMFQLYEVWATRARDRAIKPYPHPMDME